MKDFTNFLYIRGFTASSLVATKKNIKTFYLLNWRLIMADNKKGVIVYRDWIDKFEELDDDEAGRLIKHFFRYVNDLNPTAPDRITKLMFADIKATLKRDLSKWEESAPKRSEKARNAGLASAEARRNKEQLKSTTKLNELDNSTKPTVTVTVTDKVTDTVNDNKDKEAVFKKTLISFQDKYEVDLLKEFFYYWTEKSDNGKKMRFELSKNQPFNTSRRLGTWKKNQNKFGTPKTTTEDRQAINRELFNEAIKN